MGEWIEADAVLADMSLEEKAHLVNGATFFGSYGIAHLGVPRMQLLDGATGMNLEQLFGDMTQYDNWSDSDARKEIDADTDKPVNLLGSTMLVNVIANYFAPEKLSEKEMVLYRWIQQGMEKRLHGKSYAPACYPPGILLGCTWNPAVVRMVGEALGMECCLYDVHYLLGPNVNILRDPRNGRLFEGYSEDPYVVCKLAPEMVKGIQSYGVCATVKHFAANNQETNRVGIDETISGRALEEIYFPGFRACVQEGKTQAVMNAYNRINGVRCTENTWLLQDKLRDEFGFEGLVISDWGAVSAPAPALAAGTDLAMPGPASPQAIYDAVMAGELSEEALDKACKRILNSIAWIQKHYKKDEVDKLSTEHIWNTTDAAAYAATSEGIVLLKNENVCPLPKQTKIALLGSGSRQMLECGSGSAGIDTSRHGAVEKEFARYFSLCTEAEADYAVVICVVPGMEGNDRNTLALAQEDIAILKRLQQENKAVLLVLNTCGPVDMREIDTENVKAVFAAFLPGMAGAKALADLVSGCVTPSGKLTVTFPKRMEDAPSYMNFPGEGYHVSYGEGIYVGYRYYDKKKIEPYYSFGYGLSYTTFACRMVSCQVEAKQIVVRISVENTGAYTGSEVVQIYVQDVYSVLPKPEKELKAFEKVTLAPGETKEITLTIELTQLASYDMDLKQFAVEEGYYDILASTSAREVDVFGRERIYLDVPSPYRYSADTPIRVIFENEALLTAMFSAWEHAGFDTEILRNNYEYSPQKSLREIAAELDAELRSEEAIANLLREFETSIQMVKKL